MFVKQKNTGNVLIPEGQSGCCPDDAAAGCKFVFVITDLASVTSITIDGNVHTITADDETDLGQVLAAIQAAFVAEGYILDLNAPHLTAYQNIWADTETVFIVYSNADTVALTTVPAADSQTKACIKTVACRYHAEIPVGAGLSFEISDEEVEAANPADSPQTISGDFATGSANALGLEVLTEFTELYAGTDNVTVKRVRVVENEVTAMYEVDVWLYGRHPIVTDDVEIVFEKCECVVDYTIANA